MEECEKPPGYPKTDNNDEDYSPSRPRLYSAIKYQYLPFVPAESLKSHVNPLEGGGSPAINIVSKGWRFGKDILSKRTIAFWFTFRTSEKDEVQKLNEEFKTPWEWVRSGFAVVSTCMLTLYSPH